VVSGDGIYTSINSGATWTQTSAPTAFWKSVASSSDGTKLVAVISGAGDIYTSGDSGANWSLTDADTLNWQSVASDSTGQYLVAVAAGNGIYRSTDYGTTWAVTNATNPSDWYSVASSSNGEKLVALSETIGVYTSNDSGSTWIATTLPVGFGSVASDSDGINLVAAFLGGSIYTSSNSGTSWTPTSAPTAFWRSVASSSDGTKLVACSSDAGIYTSTNSGASWTLTSAPTANWYSVASDAAGDMLFSMVTDGGSVWSYTAPPVPYPCFMEGTKIQTNYGYVSIENLRKGDLVKTLRNGFVPVNMIGYRVLKNSICQERIKNKLYKYTSAEHSEIFEDLVITGCHSILVDDFKEGQRDQTEKVLGDIYVTDRKYRLPACVDSDAKPYEVEGDITIWHVALDNDDYFMNYGIYANGLLVESTSKRYLKEISGMTLVTESLNMSECEYEHVYNQKNKFYVDNKIIC
jgi:hypothetical protein